MTDSAAKKWYEEFGINKQSYPNFFTGTNELSRSVSQAHVLRHAFELLELDGILCAESVPLVYFKLVDAIEPDAVLRLHRQFWNHGGAPVLVLISNEHVHVYSGMSRPMPAEEAQATPHSLVFVLERISEVLNHFLVSVETGEFFRLHAPSFNPDNRVDHDLLDNLRGARELLDENTQRDIAPSVLDALLCRLVFTCYLFDREVIGESYLDALGFVGKKHLSDVLKLRPVGEAKAALYKLFERLGQDFNGDLFSDDLEAEARKITNKHIQILDEFFHGTNVRTGQLPFWPYDFRFIPIETISAIYEHFLKVEDQQKGAFYTPRFLAEIVLDSALEEFGSLIGKKFLDPACGSGIFLVGLFNRIAEEWRQANPNARNDRRARELMELLSQSLFGVDINPTACRITAFSLYLAYLDKLTPRDIQELQKKGRALPRLVIQAIDETVSTNGNIRCGDFFETLDFYTQLKGTFDQFDLVIGNPPWGSIATDGTPAAQWCEERKHPIPGNQIAVAFSWKAATHVSEKGHVCLILPHGTLLNHGDTAIEFQAAWISEHTIHKVLNLADLRNFLFKEAKHPAIVVNYQNLKPKPHQHRISYWAPKADWITTQAEVIPVSPADRSEIPLRELVDDLKGTDGPQVWTQRYWGTPRDIRFIDRLSLFPRLRDHVRQSKETGSAKRWLIAEGFQPFGKNDLESSRRTLTLPGTKFIPARSPSIDLFVLEDDCETLLSPTIEVRRRIQNTDIFRAPHVLVTKGFSRVAYCDFDVSFRHALRGIHGPKEDRELLIFLSAYLRSSLANYFAFHTSPNRSMFHEEVHVNELLRLPFPMPHQLQDAPRSKEIVNEVASLVTEAANRSDRNFLERTQAVEAASKAIEPLIHEYFEVHPLESILIEDTLGILLNSIQPTQNRMPVPTVMHCTVDQQTAYRDRVCNTLNTWAGDSPNVVRGMTSRSDNLGIGIVILEKVHRSQTEKSMADVDPDVLHSLDRLRKSVPRKMRTIDPVRGLMVFDKERLYVVKPLGQRNWTQTAAFNDADEIVGTILMHSQKESA